MTGNIKASKERLLQRVLRRAVSLEWSFRRIKYHYGRMQPDVLSRQDACQIPISLQAYLEVFWKDLPHGTGPAVSLFIKNEEILRIDCFGPEVGHLHTGFFMPSSGECRLRLPEKDRAAQINRAVFEICHNWHYYQDRILIPSIRQYKLEQKQVEKAALEARELMFQFLREVPALQDKEKVLLT